MPGVGGGDQSSPSFGAAAGFLEAVDPAPPPQPLLYGLTPGYGPLAGGTPLVLTGLNFDLEGSGGTLTVQVGGSPAGNVTVVSNTLVTCDAPAGLGGGAVDVVVTTSKGADSAPDGFVYTPAILSSTLALPGGTIEVTNAGPTGGALFFSYYSSVTTAIPIAPFGTLLIGPTPLVEFLAGIPYPGPDGVHVTQAPVPTNPALIGLELPFQTVAILSLVTAEIVLTNRATTTFQ